jgi:hypothetical protein
MDRNSRLKRYPARSVPLEILLEHQEAFLKNLFKIISKEITITPEIAASDPYKKPVLHIGAQNILWMILMIILIIKTFQDCVKGL